ncbi:MAG: hypothetical protein JJ992_05195, partial [Planctomycetes bacterium]|nr:hypothetical protein [Planctomycetota bacterium]
MIDRSRWSAASRRSLTLVLVSGLISLSSCSSEPPPADETTQSTPQSRQSPAAASLSGLVSSSEQPSNIVFQEVAREAGVDFRYNGSPSPEMYMTEQNGGGIAMFDYDGDD